VEMGKVGKVGGVGKVGKVGGDKGGGSGFMAQGLGLGIPIDWSGCEVRVSMGESGM
jgi:hypothetical protein